jgi:hypothetical protein
VDLVRETIAVRVQRTIAEQAGDRQVTDQQAIVQRVTGQPVIGQRVRATVQPEIVLRVLDLAIPVRVVVVVGVDQMVAITAHVIANPMIAMPIEMTLHRSLA